MRSGLDKNTSKRTTGTVSDTANTWACATKKRIALLCPTKPVAVDATAAAAAAAADVAAGGLSRLTFSTVC